MNVLNKKEPILLFLGDIAIFYLSLIATLFLRNLGTPSFAQIQEHVPVFSFLIFCFLLVMFIFGLYDTRRVIFRNKIPEILLKIQSINIFISIAFFYFTFSYSGDSGITPKITLVLYVFLSFVFLMSWRVFFLKSFSLKKKTEAILVASGAPAEILTKEINANPRYGFSFSQIFSPEDLLNQEKIDAVLKTIKDRQIKIVVLDMKNKEIQSILYKFYNLIFTNIQLIDSNKMYEEIFYRIPVSSLRHGWFLENTSHNSKKTFDVFKRLMDVMVAFPLLILSIPFYILVYVLIKLDDGGPIFVTQERVGLKGKSIYIAKFRSMSKNETNLLSGSQNKITKIGKFLRKTRIDELPQLWSVIKGDQSLIGPRPELRSGVSFYEEKIPFYNVRHLIKPGLSGWAQIYHENHPHHGVDVVETTNKLSYDIYYIKNRSFVLDVIIALKTLKTLLGREGK
ncbi:MAG: hypothetical protein QG585_569 [Patescibacteria group bacterium]|jgi:exopolysaccharide biosynthesis polyprenyl glycosylphosphotransferase|nr:hypothetical protein [Patescibacteria group bacterium]